MVNWTLIQSYAKNVVPDVDAMLSEASRRTARAFGVDSRVVLVWVSIVAFAVGVFASSVFALIGKYRGEKEKTRREMAEMRADVKNIFSQMHEMRELAERIASFGKIAETTNEENKERVAVVESKLDRLYEQREEQRKRSEGVVDINVGGAIYTTTTGTLEIIVDGLDEESRDDQGRLFIDRDGALFHWILEYCRGDEDHYATPSDFDTRLRLAKEATFFGFPYFAKELSNKRKITEREVFEHCAFHGCKFIGGWDLSGLDLSGFSFQGVEFNNVTMIGGSFKGCSFHSSSMVKGDKLYATPVRFDGVFVDVEFSDIRTVVVGYEYNGIAVTFSGTFKRCTFTSMERINYTEAHFENCTLNGKPFVGNGKTS